MFWIFFRPSREQLADWFRDKRLRPLRRAVSLATPEGRAIAAEYLGELRDKGALKALSSALLRDKVAAVRRSAAQSLGKLGAEALPVLSQALRQDTETLVRETAASSIGLIQDKSAAPILESTILTDAKATVRAAAALSLGQIGAEQSIPRLRASLLAGHPLLTEGAARALALLSFGPKLEGRERAAYLVGLDRFIEAAESDHSIMDLLLLRAALSRDGSAMPEGLLEAICRIASPDAVQFLGLRLQSLRRVLSGGPVPEVYERLKKEAQMLETALRTVNNQEAQTFLSGYAL